MAADALQESLGKASFYINQATDSDNDYADLSTLFGALRSNDLTIGGLDRSEYQVLGYGTPEVGSSKIKVLPAELQERFKHLQCSCLMGLFSEINRAWLAVDNEIFLWTYEDGSDLTYYDGLRELILSAALVKPKPNIFQPHIVYLLVLATPVEVVLLGVSFSNANSATAGTNAHGYNEMQLMPEPLYAVPTDNVQMLAIKGTDNGRIFMAGRDGCLYEIEYQGDLGWFGRRSCSKINHSQSYMSYLVPSFMNSYFTEDDSLIQICVDETRKILYTRSQKNTIQVFDLGANGTKTKRIACLGHERTLRKASDVIRNVEQSKLAPIVYIAPIPPSDSEKIHLVAVTHAGVRLYYSTQSYDETRQPLSRPEGLVLVHVRMPPGGLTGPSDQDYVSNVHSAVYSQGTFLMVASRNDGNDILWTISSDSFPFQKQLIESYDKLPLVGRSWAMTDISFRLPTSSIVSLAQNSLDSVFIRSDPPTVVNQHFFMNKRFVIVNSIGTYILTKQSPCDQLNHLLLRHGAESEPVKSYFRQHREQAFATCLVLMSSRSFAHQQVNSVATRAFFLYNGDPSITSSFGQPLPTDQTLLTPMTRDVRRNLTFHSPGTSIWTPNVDLPATSLRHRSLYLYLQRILRPIWQSVLVTPIVQQQNQLVYLANNVDSELIVCILQKLQDFQSLLKMNPGLFSFTSSMPMDSFGVGHNIQREVESEESVSLKNLELLLDASCQCLGMWKILADHQFHVIASRLDEDQQSRLQKLTFEQLVQNGRDLCQVLLKRLIDLYIDDNAATDVISSRLRDACPSLYSTQDEIYAKGNENLKMAKSKVNTMERQKLIAQAIQQYKSVCMQVDLPSMCAQLSSVRAYGGIVDLVLTAANKRDQQCLALHFYLHGKPISDVEGALAYNIRMDCYKSVTETLDHLRSVPHQNPQEPGIQPAIPAADATTLTSDDAKCYAEEMFNSMIKSDDQMAHIALYEWMIRRNLSEDLLDIASPFVEQYLKQEASLHAEPRPILDLLCNYYNKHKKFSAAARILDKLAERRGTHMNLMERMSYLSRATLCVQSAIAHTSAPGDGDFLHELQDKVEVVMLQIDIFNSIKNSNQPSAQIDQAIDRLNSQLFDVSELFQEFASVFDLPVCKLAIIHCAGHRDSALIESLWKEIIDKELGSMGRQDPSVKINAFVNAFVNLGKLYLRSENYFPLFYLVKYLEQLNVTLGFDDVDLYFACRSFLEIGVSLTSLHDVYEKLFKLKEPLWRNSRKPYHLVAVDSYLIAQFINQSQQMPSLERRHFVTKCLDSMSLYLVELQAETMQVSNLVKNLRDLQIRLERMESIK